MDSARIEQTPQALLSALSLEEKVALLARLIDQPRGGAGLDGRELYGPNDSMQLPMADLLHPDPPAHRLIGARIAPSCAGWP